MTPKTKVLYVITKSNFGGAQRYVYDLATHLPTDAYDVAVALGGTGTRGAPAGSLKEKLEAAHVRTIAVPHFTRDMSLLDDLRAFVELWHIVRAERPDIVHVTSSKAGGLGALVGRLTGVPRVVFTSHGLTFDESWRPQWQRTAIWLFTWLTILLATHTIQISSDTYERARRMPFVRRKVVLIHNGIDRPNFLSRTDARIALVPDATRAVYESPWLGTIAEYHPNKNLDVLIDAIALLKAQGTTAHLVLIGDGEERARLSARARAQGVDDRVHLAGYVRDAARYLEALDIFTLPSTKEGLPYVLLEAGLAKRPVVVSDITGTTEIVTNGTTGCVVTASPHKLADAFQSLLTNHNLAERYAGALYTYVATEFSIAHMLASTLALYTPSNPSTSLSRSSRRTERS